ncbi:succinylglutamate desuccinylase/aspartoacylase family protein [Alsobacter sp. SYSU M60028]|uniref:Succinylglutamate desuccinylase/aspartoacylase family protein n=1 Tax=Alsobacter ponti TaxID=2962936 RepID=A0ABT1L7N2_9HYPH|nr:succinylglutamate desuccinylase/aspartoacylase family protein [Alsobacter ponti]MCP8937474.1 succinylglutamate desuccinylase/aspartoacylase family protein [Alsobacter ponti]
MRLAPSVEIDLDAGGKAFGRVVFPLEAPWNGRHEIVLPACVIGHGKGPTVALWGGNHGDEYEGPLVLGQMARELDPEAVEGRLIILPSINPPAVLAGQRVSAIDGKNMNRVWPGDPEGTITERIVSWLDTELLSRADVLMDLHTGGNAMDIVPMSMCHHSDDLAFRDRIRAAQLAYNAPLSVELRLPPDRPTASGRAHDRGILVVGSESGGGHPARPESLCVCHDGVRNTLAFLEVLPPPVPLRARAVTRLTRKWGFQAEMATERPGMFVPYRGLWDEVVAGEPAGRFVPLDDPFATPETLRFPASGLIAARRASSGVQPGDVLYWIVADVSGEPRRAIDGAGAGA